jgi:tetratricopeptide (TPR) repeat protein
MDVDAINTLASILVKQKKPKEAIAKLQEALTIDPKRAATLGNLGQAYASSGQYEKAADYYELALKSEPDVPNFHFGLALVQMSLGRREEALLQLQEASRLDPNNPDVQLRLGLLLHSLNQLAPAATAYRRALELKPDWWEPQANLAVLLSMNPDPAGRNPMEAVRLAEAAVASTKRKSADAMDALGAAKLAEGDPTKALEIEQEALSLAQEEKSSDKILRIQERLNLIRAAQRQFRRTASDDRGP